VRACLKIAGTPVAADPAKRERGCLDKILRVFASPALRDRRLHSHTFSLAVFAPPRLLARMRTLPHSRSCFVCGDSNPIGLKLRLETDGRIVQTQFVPGSELVGFKQTMHGGIVGTLLDEVMAWACAVQAKRFAYCAELTVRFLQPVRPGEELIVSGELVHNRRGRIFEAKSELRDPTGNILATATGKYLPVKQAHTTELATDLVCPPSWEFGSEGILRSRDETI